MATEKRLIEIRKRVKFAGDVHQELLKAGCDLETATRFVNSIPDVDAVEVVHGRWEKHTIPGYDYFGVPALIPIACNCSVCGRDGRNETPYCPNCGAKMDGDGNERC